MSGNSLDPEVLAALLDGKLSHEQREQALAQIARSPQDYELFVEAANTLNDLTATGAPDSNSDARPVSVRRWGPVIGVLMAATIAALVVVPPLLRSNPDQPRGLLDGVTLVAGSASTFDAALGSDWGLAGWSVVRGEASLLSTEQRAFRIGARLADLDAALDAQDPTATRFATAELITLLHELDASAPLVRLFEQLRTDADLDGAARTLRDFIDSPHYKLGLLLEQARLASLAGSPGLFDRTYVRALRRAADDAALPAATRSSIDQLLESIQEGSTARDLPEFQQQVVALIRSLAG